jgi:hypothetical protein
MEHHNPEVRKQFYLIIIHILLCLELFLVNLLNVITLGQIKSDNDNRWHDISQQAIRCLRLLCLLYESTLNSSVLSSVCVSKRFYYFF